jgi:hypothetical protein
MSLIYGQSTAAMADGASVCAPTIFNGAIVAP